MKRAIKGSGSLKIQSLTCGKSQNLKDFATLARFQPTPAADASSNRRLGKRRFLMKRALKIVGIVIVALIVIVVVLPFVINVNDFRPRIETELTNALGRKVTVGNLSLSLITGSLGADNIAIADDPSFGTSPFIQAKKLDVGVEMLPLIFSKTLHITDITLSQPQVNLLRDRSGKWN